MDEIDSCLPGGQAPSHWYDTWDRQSCQSFTSTAKGLRNAPGENNCFLNSAVQVFWHIDVFRRSYRRLSGHLCMGNSCIFCALKVIFTQFQYSDQSSLQPSALRQALAKTFAKQERFQLGHMDDAAECFENILHRIHYHIADKYNEDTCSAPHCIPHQKFAMTVADQLVCPCGSSSEPLKFHEMVHYISANALVSQSRTMQETGDVLHPNRFGLLLRNAGAVGNVRDCPGNCGKRVQIRRTLLNVPDVVSIGLVWGSDRPDPELTTEVAKTIGTTLLLPDIVHSVMCNDVSTLPRLHLSSMVCYYGKHYSTFVWHTKLNCWVYFDDATVKEIGTRWENVVEKIVRSRYQPLLLIYSNPAALPVTTETAPSTRVMAPGYSITPGKGNQENENKGAASKVVTESGRGQRSLTPSFENGNIRKTPSPEEQICGKETLSRTSSFENRRQSSFLIAMTSKSRGKGQECLYQVPHNNTLVESPREAVNREKTGQNSVNGGIRTDNNSENGQDYTDSYNYTLSNSDQYRRPGLSSPDHNNLPLTWNFSRANEMQRKESLKKGKGKVPADVIRYQTDPARRPSVDSDQGGQVVVEGANNETVSQNKPALPAKPTTHIRTRSQSLEDNLGLVPDTANNPHTVVKPVPSNPSTYENVDSVTRAHTPVQSGLATLPRKKKTAANENSSISSIQNRQGPQPGDLSNTCHNNIKDSSQKMPNNLPYFPIPPKIQNSDGSGLPANMNYNSADYKNLVNYQNLMHDTDNHSRQSSNSSLLSQGTVVECNVNDHSRQSSLLSQDTLTDKTNEKTEKSEKVKESKAKSSKRKEEKRSKLKKEKKDQSSSSSKPPPGPEKKQVEKEKQTDEGFHDGNYIKRNMVESVLSFQKLQRSGSCVSQTSNSSLESDSSYYMKGRGIFVKDNSSSDIPFDTASLESHKDSGYGSSDRNSSSSTGSITMNPFEQYFVSRSMIPPKYVNEQAVAEHMKKLMNQGPGPSGLGYTQEKDLKSLVVNPNEHYNTDSTVGYCNQPQYPSQFNKGHSEPPSQTSTPRDISGMSKEERNQQIFEALTNRQKPIPPPEVPNKPNHGPPPKMGNPTVDAISGRTGKPMKNDSIVQGVPSAYQETHRPKGEGGHQYSNSFNEVLSCGNDEFLSLCQKAEDYMDQCVLAETSEQYSNALNCCQLAINQLTTAMRLPNVNGTSHSYAQKKSNSCLLKLRSLQKRLSSSGGGSEYNSNQAHRNQRPGTQPQRSPQGQVPHGMVKPPSRSSSQNSVDSLKDGNLSSGSGRSSTPVFDGRNVPKSQPDRAPPPPPAKMRGPAPPPTDSRVPPTDYNTAYKDRSFETNVPTDTSADLYGTLPRRKTQKSQEHTQLCNNQKHESEIYQDFLENQRRQNIHHSRTNSGATTPVNENQTFSETVKYNYSVAAGPAQVRQQSGSHGGNSHGNMRYPAAAHTTVPCVPVLAPEIRHQSQHTEVGKTAVNPSWQQPPGGATRVVHSNTLPRGNIVIGKIPTASSAAIQTAYSASVASAHSGQCEPVPPPIGSHSGHVINSASAASSASRSSRNVASENQRRIDRSASFSHTCPPAYSQLFPSHTATKRRQFPWEPKLERSHGTSQPDLRQLSSESLTVKRPLTPQVLCSETEEADSKPVSVRDLASRFESSGISDGNKAPGPGVNRSQDLVCEKQTPDTIVNSHCKLGPSNSATDFSSAMDVMHQRHRSKSESDFLASKPSKPKSVLAKKNKGNSSKPRKSVTFSANICLVEAVDNWSLGDDDNGTEAGYQSDEEGCMEKSRGMPEEEDSSTSADSPVEILGEGACTLCHKKGVQEGQSYCDKCNFYMSRFQPR